MMGTRLLGWLPLALALAVGVGCGGTGTDLNEVVSGDDGGLAQGNNPPPTPYQDPFAGAPAYSGPQSGGDGSHHAGEACMQQGCHSTAAGGRSDEAPSFLIGGTVYEDYYGQVPAAGVEVRIVDMNGNAASAYSGREGNFYIRAGGSVGFPAVIGARDASISRPMIRQLGDPSMGSCAQSPCHVAGGSPANGTYYPIHVP